MTAKTVDKLRLTRMIKLESALHVNHKVNSCTNLKDDYVIFEVSTSQAPAYSQSLIKSLLDDKYNKTRNVEYNDYYTDGKNNSKIEKICKE